MVSASARRHQRARDDVEIAIAVEIHRLRAVHAGHFASVCSMNGYVPLFSSHWIPWYGFKI